MRKATLAELREFVELLCSQHGGETEVDCILRRRNVRQQDRTVPLNLERYSVLLLSDKRVIRLTFG